MVLIFIFCTLFYQESLMKTEELLLASEKKRNSLKTKYINLEQKVSSLAKIGEEESSKLLQEAEKLKDLQINNQQYKNNNKLLKEQVQKLTEKNQKKKNKIHQQNEKIKQVLAFQ